MPRPRCLPVLLASATLVLPAPPARPSTILPLDLRTLTGDSTLIVLGQVRSVADRSTESLLFQEVTIEVVEVLRGRFDGPRLIVRVRQGLVNFDRILKRG